MHEGAMLIRAKKTVLKFALLWNLAFCNCFAVWWTHSLVPDSVYVEELDTRNCRTGIFETFWQNGQKTKMRQRDYSGSYANIAIFSFCVNLLGLRLCFLPLERLAFSGSFWYTFGICFFTCRNPLNLNRCRIKWLYFGILDFCRQNKEKRQKNHLLDSCPQLGIVSVDKICMNSFALNGVNWFANQHHWPIVSPSYCRQPHILRRIGICIPFGSKCCDERNPFKGVLCLGNRQRPKTPVNVDKLCNHCRNSHHNVCPRPGNWNLTFAFVDSSVDNGKESRFQKIQFFQMNEITIFGTAILYHCTAVSLGTNQVTTNGTMQLVALTAADGTRRRVRAGGH